ncbi:MAG: hypothetical protein MJ014_02420 [Methanocorpusculum sp.]|nr:hypothetical protein [Methanocorpusculum sp.]
MYPGNTAFVYEQIKVKIRNGDGPSSYATSISYMTGDANPQVSVNGITKNVPILDTAATDVKSWGVVTTAADGKRRHRL